MMNKLIFTLLLIFPLILTAQTAEEKSPGEVISAEEKAPEETPAAASAAAKENTRQEEKSRKETNELEVLSALKVTSAMKDVVADDGDKNRYLTLQV